MSWELKRLSQSYAWKKSISFVTVILLLIIIIGEYVIHIASIETNLSLIFRILGYGLLFCIILDNVCHAVESFHLNGGDIIVNTYDEKDKYGRKVYRIVCLCLLGGKVSEEVFYAETYRRLDKSVYADGFIYYPLKGDKWYYWKHIGKSRCLGKRINDILFNNEESKSLSFIERFKINNVSYDRYFCHEDLYFSKETQFFSEDNIPLHCPQKVILVQKGNKYDFYEFCLSDLMSHYRKIIVSSVIIKDEQKRTILVRKNEEYVVLADKEVFSRQLNSIIIEAKSMSNKGLEVIVWHFDAKEQKLQKLYEGIAYAIDFEEGNVIGEDGKTYG